MIKISRVRPADGDSVIAVDCELSDADTVYGEGKQQKEKTFYLLVDDYSVYRFDAGPLGEEEAKLLVSLDERCRALRHARRLLEFSGNTGRELTLKLRRRGYSREAADFAAERCAEEGAIDEQGDAVRKAELEVKKGRGKSRIVSELLAKGYCSEAVKSAAEYLDGVDFAEVCAKVIKAKYKTFPAEPDEKKKAVAALARLGFTSSDIKNALKKRK